MQARKFIFLAVTGVSWSIATAGCSPEEPAGTGDPDVPADNVVRSGEDVDVVIGDAVHDFHVVSSGALARMDDVIPASEAVAAAIVPETDTIAQSVTVSGRRSPRDSLVVGYPVELLGESAVFGGVITRVSVPDDPAVGNLKLASLQPLHVRPLLAPTNRGGYALALVGCAWGCSETSPQEPQITIPVRGVRPKKKKILLDLASLGEGLSVSQIIDPAWAGLVEVESRTTFVDYSKTTLVFDVESELVPAPDSGEPSARTPGPAPGTVFVTTRWYLRLGSGFQDAFTPRELLSEFGYFTTARNTRSLITRFAATRYEDRAPVKYYVKNVPAEYRDAFSAAFEDWNQEFRALLGYDLLAHEFIDAGDPRHALLVNGDVRFNIIEWDVDNLASYGGLGPSLAHQFTGEIFSGQVLIQGPDIVRLYSDWFEVLEQAAALRAAGDAVGAERALVEGRRRVQERLAGPAGARVRLGQLDMIVPAEEPGLHDPLMSLIDFDDTPPGVSFETYMQGYFREIVAHELGHNLGLMHNFKGSLGGNGDDLTSHSVMEYVVRTERHLTRVGEYDRQAIAYGYTGEIAAEPLPYCNDYELPWLFEPTLSAECSSSDAGPDAFAYFREMRVRRAIDLVIGRGLGAAAPEWTLDDVVSPFWAGLEGMGFYATSAEATAHTWSSFYLDPGRPTDPQAIREYVIAEIQGTICEPSIVAEIQARHALDPAAGQMARDNWAAALEMARLIGEYLGLPLGDCALLDELGF
jgi:hypothetical protein